MSQRLTDLSARVAADEWDADAWSALCVEASSNLPYRDAAVQLERATGKFPSAGRLWKLRAESAAKSQEDSAVRDIAAVYREGVKAAPTSIELWRAFANWAARNSDTEDPVRVYEDAIKAAGLDLTANPLWSDYIALLNKIDWPENQRRDALRKVYQRAVRNPMHELDQFWQQYRSFEETSNTNKELGRGLLAEAQPRYMAARAEFRARRIRREGLALNALPVPPRGRPKEASQAAQWRKFISTERSNLHNLDEVSLHARVVHAYETALAPLFRYPDIWIDYLSYLADIVNGQGSASSSGSVIHGSNVGQAASSTPGSASTAGGTPNSAPGSGDASLATRDDLDAAASRAMSALPDCVALHHHISWLWMRADNPSKAVASLEALVKSSPSPLAYVHLMRLTRKVSGKDAARKVFARARRDPKGTDPAVYVAAAQMEFIVNKDNKIARNVYEFGLKHYGTSAVMVREFTEWLWGLGDFDHLRIVLKRAMSSVEGPADVVRSLWERWIELEEAVGDVASVESVEQLWRDSGAIRAQNAVNEAVRRSRFLGMEGLKEEELAVMSGPQGSGSLGAAQLAPTSHPLQGGGKRDPRTGRRVASQGVGGNAGAVGSLETTGSLGTGANTSAGAGATSGCGVNGILPGDTFSEIEGNLRLLASGMQTVRAPPPDFETLSQLLQKVPDEFTATPVGGGGIMGSNSAAQFVGIPKSAPRTGLKRQVEEPLPGSAEQSGSLQPGTQADSFRSRPPQKQTRLR